jgi:hypothetical protein
MTTTISEIIKQNTLGQSEGFPIGVPESWNWYKGWNGEGQETPPSNMTAVEGWAQIYREKGSTYENPNAMVTIDNAKTWVRLKATKQWVEVQNQDKQGIAGGHFVTDFKGNAGSPINVIKNADGSVSFKAPTSTYNDHFWFGARGTFSANTVDAVYTQYDMKVNDPNIKLVGSVGADWWLNASAPYMQDHSTNPGVGSGNWIDITTQYKTIGYFSLPTPEFVASHPSGIFSGSGPAPTPAPTPTPTPTPTLPPAPDLPADGEFKPGDLKLTLSGDAYNGDPKAEVFVDGQSVGTVTVTADHAAGQWQDVVIKGNGRWADGTDHSVQVKFLNDAYGGSPAADRNLYAKGVELNGIKVQAPDRSIASHTFQVDDTPNSAPGTPVPSPVPTPADPALDKISVRARADVYNGGANFKLLVDGKLVDATNLVTATRMSGDWQTFDFTGDFDAAGVQSHKVQIVFDNDAFGGSGKDRNLYIDEVSFNGVSNGQDWAYPVNGSHAWDFAL